VSEADAAYAFARAEIERVRQSGETELDLFRPEARALEALPSEIDQLTILQSLSLSNTHVSDITVLGGLTGLQVLNLTGVQASDITPLAGLKGLQSLYLDNTQVSDITALGGLTGLQSLYLTGTPISDIRALGGLTGLQRLDLYGTQVSDLLPLRSRTRLGEESEVFGLTFQNCVACKIDPRIKEISEIKDNEDRVRTLFDYLKTWTPPKQRGPEPGPPTPAPKPAPLLAELVDGRMVRAAPGHLPQHDALARAEMGWEALRLYRQSFGDTFNVHNHAPLPRFLAAFDQAMGEHFDPKRMIMIGMMGTRIVDLSKNIAFLTELPIGADADLSGFAAEISTWLNRFPDWLTYQEEARGSAVTRGAMLEEQKALRALVDAMDAEGQVDPSFSAEFHAEIDGALSETGDDGLAHGAIASAREASRVLSEKALEGVKSGAVVREDVRAMEAVADGEVAKAKFWSYGWTLVLLKRTQAPLRRLAARFPSMLGWLPPVLDYLVGAPD